MHEILASSQDERFRGGGGKHIPSFPRLGSFEVWVFPANHWGPPSCLHSKVATRRFPLAATVVKRLQAVQRGEEVIDARAETPAESRGGVPGSRGGVSEAKRRKAAAASTAVGKRRSTTAADAAAADDARVVASPQAGGGGRGRAADALELAAALFGHDKVSA